MDWGKNDTINSQGVIHVPLTLILPIFNKIFIIHEMWIAKKYQFSAQNFAENGLRRKIGSSEGCSAVLREK